jgi:hypothetical protein
MDRAPNRNFERPSESSTARASRGSGLLLQRPGSTAKPGRAEQYDKVCEFRDELEQKGVGVLGRYKKLRGSRDAFVEQVKTNLSKLVQQFIDEREKRISRKRRLRRVRLYCRRSNRP